MDKLLADKLIELLKQGKDIPIEYQDILFPIDHKEYELTYKGKKKKQAILSSANEPQSVPFQIQKQFGIPTEWNNLLIFGDNYQILKTINENKDELIKNKVKGKVKLIYIDPPFATQDEFSNKEGAKAYSDKVKGAEFIEFLRQRLILAREILADDGSIFVHLDNKMGHYIKVVLDEIFDKNNFRCEIIWQKLKAAKKQASTFGNLHDTILYYSKSDNFIHNKQFKKYSSERITQHYSHIDENGRRFTDDSFTQTGQGPARYFGERGWLEPPKDKHWIWSQEKIDDGLDKGLIIFTSNGTPRVKRYLDERKGNAVGDIWTDIYPINSQAKEAIDYPTQKPEKLLERIISSSTNEGDLVMDFFAGSGTTLAVAEKLNRRWIGCDIGKLSIYTIQKRLLTKNSHKPFALVNAAIYDLSEVFGLDKIKYDTFVKDLFHIESEKKTVCGVAFDGKRRGDWAKIFDFHYFKGNPAIDERYIEELHKIIGKKIGSKVYLVAPEMNIDIIDDYIELDGVRYYLLRIPYQAIKELHKESFKKPKQPNSKINLNNIETSIGFYFNEEPEVKSKIKSTDNQVILDIEHIEPQYESTINNDNILAMVLLDTTNGKEFVMQKYFFADEIVSQSEGIQYTIKLNKNELRSKKIKIVYIDVFGNEFTETLEVQ